MDADKPRKLTTVVCACIRRSGGQEVLLSLRRAPGVSGLDGKWELPGGKIEFGETPQQALVREIREEVGLEVRPTRLLPYLHTNVWEYRHALQHVVLACYECEVLGESDQTLGADARWFRVDAIDFGQALPGTREFTSLALRQDWFDKLFISFELTRPTIRASSQFALASQPTLFSQYGLVKYWHGKKGWIMRAEDFASPREMDSSILVIAKRRLSQGYRITALAGQAERYHVLEQVVELARQKRALAEDAVTN